MGLIDRVARHIASGSVPLRPNEVAHEAGELLGVLSPVRADEYRQAVVDRVLGLGPVEELLRDPSVTDVLVNGPDEIWVERAGELVTTSHRYGNSNALMGSIERVLAPLGLRIDRAAPFVDARLPDGSRFHAVIPPAAVDHPVVAVRRFTRAVETLDALVSAGSATSDQVAVMRRLLSERKTILISGGTGTGKTTLLNLLAAQLPASDRIVTIEDAAEIEIDGHVVRLEARPPNAEGAGEITIRQLLRSALRLRPDRVIVGEVRGPEALDLVWALNTGHRGSISTIHANSPDEALWRLETLALSGGEVSSDAIRRQIDAAIGAIVQLERDGPTRRVAEIVVPDD